MLEEVWTRPEYRVSPRGQPIREITNTMFTVDLPISEAIVTKDHDRNAVLARYFEDEKRVYASLTNSAEEFGKIASMWPKLANPDGTVNSAYGYLLFKQRSVGNCTFENNRDGYRTPWEWAVQSLKEDRDTRQAIMPFLQPTHFWRGNKDFVCTLQGVWQIRDDRLNFSISMRSNDLVTGLAYDMPWFVHLMDKMVEELRPMYPSLVKGRYTHHCHSSHIYEKSAEKVKRMLGLEL